VTIPPVASPNPSGNNPAKARRFASTNALILVALFAFPADPRVWQAASWALVAALLALLALVVVSGVVLAMRPAARKWPRIALFLVGLACLLAVAAGSL
jgi:uncharacterized membrane protein SirB2